jgi:hypothetical protein
MINSLQRRVAKLEGAGAGGCAGAATTLVYSAADGRVLAASCAGFGRQHPERVRETLAGRGTGAEVWIPYDGRNEIPAATRWAEGVNNPAV